MSKLSFRKIVMPVLSVVAIVIVSMAMFFAGSGQVRSHRAGTDQPFANPSAQGLSAEQRNRVRASIETLPLAFEANQGQTDPRVKYMARGNGYKVFLTGNETVFALTSRSRVASPVGRGGVGTTSQPQPTETVAAAIHMKLVGANAPSTILPEKQLPGRSNYFIGNDPSKWQQDLKQYAEVSYRDVYRGVNMKFHGQQRQVEFDFIVGAGASAAPIRFDVTGADKIITDPAGNLVLSSAAGDVLLHKPVAYQEKGNERQFVDARFAVQSDNSVSFELGKYDPSRELVIDPSVSYSYATYLGGSSEDDGYGVAVDSSGNVYVTGQTESTDFPTVTGSYSPTNKGLFDAFVTKISADGATLLYSTYVGGSGEDSGNAIAVDGSGDAFVAGGTGSSDFPFTSGAFQKTPGGDLDAFVLELNPAGTALTYSTYLGGSNNDYASGIALDASGDAYIVGTTFSTNFPTHTPIQANLAGSSNGFVSKINSSGSTLVYSTYLGGGTGDFAAGVAVDSAGNAYVTGGTPNSTFPVTTGAYQGTCASCAGGFPDAFVSVINTAGNNFVYSTFLGGSGIDEGLAIAVDSSGDAYVTGLTESANFPLKSALYSTLGGTQDAFVTELNSSGSTLVYSTFLGGSQDDAGAGIAVDGSKNTYVTGQTASPDFPLKGATQGTIGGGNDAFVSEIGPSGSSLLFSTFLGGSGDENTNISGGNLSALGSIAVDSAGQNIYVAGNTASSNFPVVAAVQSTYGGSPTDAFVAHYATQADFQIGATTPTAVNPGNSGTSTVTLTSENGYGLPVTLSCSVTGTGSPLPSCSASSAFSTNPLTPTSGGATSTLTIATTGASAATNRSSSIFYAMWLPVLGFTVIGIRFSTADSPKRKLLGFLLLGIVMSMLFFLPACGGSNGGGGGGGCTGCTPAGNYTVTITGTDANNLSHSTQVTLTVN